MSRDVANALGVEEGGSVRLPTPTGVRDVAVLQIIPFFSLVGGVVLMDFHVFEDWYLRSGATVLNVFYKHDADSAAVTAAIREVVPAELNVETGKDAVASVAAGQGAAMSNAILWIVCFVATVALLNTKPAGRRSRTCPMNRRHRSSSGRCLQPSARRGCRSFERWLRTDSAPGRDRHQAGAPRWGRTRDAPG